MLKFVYCDVCGWRKDFRRGISRKRAEKLVLKHLEQKQCIRGPVHMNVAMRPMY